MTQSAHNDASRSVIGSILLMAAVFSIVGAGIFESFGMVSRDMGPLPFVGAVLFLKLGLFSFWPVIKNKGKQASTLLHDIDPAQDLFTSPVNQPAIAPKRRLSLWDQNDPRLDLSLFYNSVPSFVLNHEQRFLDWNPAFDLIFGREASVKRGGHVSIWFDLLDNYRRVSKRAEKLYGEGILPLADRERAVYLSPEYGRMVFTKIMTPIVDRGTGRVIGWTVVLNINSINKRNEFFDKLYARIALETRRLRHAASYNGLFENYQAFQNLMDRHVLAVGDSKRVLELGAGSGLLTEKLATVSRRITAVDYNIHLLRQLRDRIAPVAHRVKIVKQSPDHLGRLPIARFDAATLMLSLHKISDPVTCLQQAFSALKPGGTICVSAILDMTIGGDSRDSGLNQFFNALRTDLERQGHFENLKHQFNHVLEHERELAMALPYRALTRNDIRVYLLEAGFELVDEVDGLLDGFGIMLTARKPL